MKQPTLRKRKIREASLEGRLVRLLLVTWKQARALLVLTRSVVTLISVSVVQH
jgi:hypothetical protein